MIVEKGQQQQLQQLTIQREQQQQQRQQQQQIRHHLHRSDQLLPGDQMSDTDLGEDEDDGDNDEENIVIDMADEDDDDDDDDNHQDANNHDIDRRYTDNQQQQQYINNNNNNSPFGVISVFTNNKSAIENKIESDQNANKSSTAIIDYNHTQENNTSSIVPFQFNIGDLVWFDPNLFGYSIPGKVVDYYPSLSVLTVEGHAQPAPLVGGDAETTNQVDTIQQHNKLLLAADDERQVYDLSDIQQFSTVKLRCPFSDECGLSDLVDLDELSQESIIWNLKLRYKQELVYTRCGHKILLSVNPFKQLCNTYNLDQVNKYDTVDSNKLRSLQTHPKCCPNGAAAAANTTTSNNHTTDQHGLHTNNNGQHCASSLIRWLLLHDDGSATTAKLKQKKQQQQTSLYTRDPHIFGLANEALKRLLISGQDQCFVLLGESGSGKTEASKLLLQYLATVNKSPTNLMTEQILESIQVLESFGNAKTVHNDNSSRFGRLVDVRFNMSNGFITDAKTIELNLLDRTRIVSQAENERNYHIFYELLSGLSTNEKEKYGLQTAEKYFYLNQGHCVELSTKEDEDDFRSLLASMQVLGFNYEEQDTIFRLLASVLHLGNIYFHRKVLAVRSGKLAQQQQKLLMNETAQVGAGVEGVEIGSDTEVRWVSHLLQIQFDSVMRCLTVRTTEASSTLPGGSSAVVAGQQQHYNNSSKVVVDRIVTPLNIDQALDTRDAIARALYTCLFKWLVQRINAVINGCTGGYESQATSSGNATATNQSSSKIANKEPVYLCRTSESLCEFQPDKLTANTDSSRQSSLSRSHQKGYPSSQVSSGSQTSNKQQQQQLLSSATISILDAFGFENLNENNFEQLCINYTAELLHYHTSRYLLRLEQAEYVKERLRWTPIQAPPQSTTCNLTGSLSRAPSSAIGQQQHGYGSGGSNSSNTAAAIVNLISKKPLGILALLDDECNFPKATDQSFVEKCHHNHTQNENYHRARLASNSQEFGVRHFRQPNRLVWYQVDGFIEKNRDTLRPDIVDLLMSSKMSIVADMLRKLHFTRGSLHQEGGSGVSCKTLSRTYDGRYVSMKPRATTVAARFQDILHNNRVLESINYSTTSSGSGSMVASSQQQLPSENAYYCSSTRSASTCADHTTTSGHLGRPNPWFVICVKPNRSKTAQVFDVAYVQDQVRCMSLFEIAQVRKIGYPVRMRYGEFVRRYKCLVPQKFLNNLASCQDIQAANQRALTMANKNGHRVDKLTQSNNGNGNGKIKRAIREVCSAIIEYRFLQRCDNADGKHATSTNSQSTTTIRDQYQCGLTKMFLNERLYHQIEEMRLFEHQKAIHLLQKTLRMWLIRRDYLVKRQAAIVIQAQIRAYLCRREFWRQYLLIVGLQRKWRQTIVVKRRKMIEAKRRAQRQQQQHQLQELQAQQRKQANQFRYRVQPGQLAKRFANSTSNSDHYSSAATRLGLDIPEDLAHLYRLQRNWVPVHDLSHINEISFNELVEREKHRSAKYKRNSLSVPFVVVDGKQQLKLLPNYKQTGSKPVLSATKLGQIMQELEVDERYSLQSFLLKYYTIESPQFGYSRLPITRPFSWQEMAQKRRRALRRWSSGGTNQEADQIVAQINHRYNVVEHKAIAMYKLMLRYIDSDLETPTTKQQPLSQQQLGGDCVSVDQMQKLVKFKLIADYLIYLCLSEPLLRDEIYLQLISQSWQNPKLKSSENVWKLMMNCLACFGPLGTELTKFLIKHASDYCCDKYRQMALDRLSQTLAWQTMSHSDNVLSRSRKYPPTMLEYWANQQAIGNLALAASCYMDDHALNGPPPAQEVGDETYQSTNDTDEIGKATSFENVNITNHSNKTLVRIGSQTTAEQLAEAVLRTRQVPEINLTGWSVEIQYEGAQSEFSCRLRGDDQILDHLARVELLPEFAQLIDDADQAEETPDEQIGGWARHFEQPESPTRGHANHHHFDSDQYSTSLDHEQQQQQVHYGVASRSSGAQRRKHSVISQRSSDGYGGNNANYYHGRNSFASSDLDLANTGGRLSQTSKLNRRYLNNNNCNTDNCSEYSSPGSSTHHNHQTSAPNAEFGAQMFQHQNRRRHPSHQHHRQYPDDDLRSPGANSIRMHRRSMSMQELQLASSALNGRYFVGGNNHQHHHQLHHQAAPVSGSSHYASSYVTNTNHYHQQGRQNAGSLQQLSYNSHQYPSAHQQQAGAPPGGRRRSQTPNSMSAQRMSSSAYGSESHCNSSTYIASVSSDVTSAGGHALNSNIADRRGRTQDRSGISAASGSRPRRSASSSSRPTSGGGPSSEYASAAAYSDYERVGGGGGPTRDSRYATPMHRAGPHHRRQPSLSKRQPLELQSYHQHHQVRAGSRPHNPLVEQYNPGGRGQQPLRGARRSGFASSGGPQQQSTLTDAREQQQVAAPPQQQKSAYMSGHYMGSSAMSDTSEAPSLASHVRGIKAPQHPNADLDQYLDDLFNPVLDEADLDEMSDARSLATSIRGTTCEIDQCLSNLCDPIILGKIIRGSDAEQESAVATESEPETNLTPIDTDWTVASREAAVLSPTFESLLKSLKGNQSNRNSQQVVSTDQIDGGSNQQQSTAAMISSGQLSGMNLRELKALNEKLEQEIQAAQSNRPSLEMVGGKIPAPPPQPSFGGPPLSMAMDDIYSRAKTVRIGKWRWPPARDQTQRHQVTGVSATDSNNQDFDNPTDQQLFSYFESKERKRLSLLNCIDNKEDTAATKQQPVDQQQQEPEVGSNATELMPPPPLPAAFQHSTAMMSQQGPPLILAGGSIGKLKISLEMKAKLEQLTNNSSGYATPTITNGNNSPTPQQVSVGGIVSQTKSLFSGAADQSGKQSTAAVKRIADQRKNLLENQLIGAAQQQQRAFGQNNKIESAGNSSDSPHHQSSSSTSASNRASSEFGATGSKVLAVKQQLAAAAGLALTALDSGGGGQSSNSSSQSSSRRQSGLATAVAPVEASNNSRSDSHSTHQRASPGSGLHLAGGDERHSRVLQDELGPQSRVAISQRQAFYQMSASSDHLADHTPIGGGSQMQPNCEHGGSEVQLSSCSSAAAQANHYHQSGGYQRIPPPPTAALSSDNLPGSSCATQQQQQQLKPKLTRAMQMSSNLNEAGQSSALGKESDIIYGQSIAKSLSQRQHETLHERARHQTGGAADHLWVSSSPDPTLESSTRRRVVKRTSTEPENQDRAKRRAPKMATSTQHSTGGNDHLTPATTAHDDVCVTYANVDWQVKIRKEFFLPSETYDDPLVVQLIFAQLVADVFNPRHWTRLNNKERAAMKSLMKDNSIGYAPSLPQIGQLQAVKRDLIRMARSFGLYFTRSYPASNFALTSGAVEQPPIVSSQVLRDGDVTAPYKQCRRNMRHRRRRRRRSSLQSGLPDSPCSSSSGSSHSEHGESDNNSESDQEDRRHDWIDIARQAQKLMHRLRNAGNLGTDWIDMVAVHHSGLRLVSVVSGEQQQQQQHLLNEGAPPTPGMSVALASSAASSSFGYKVLETLKYRDMTDVSQVGDCELLVSMRNGKKCWLISSNQAAQLGSLLRCFHADYNDHLTSCNSNNKQFTAAAAASALDSEAATVAGKTSLQRTSKEKPARTNKQHVLLVSNDDHHGDHIEQRQASDCVSRLHQAINSNNDLANSERILSSNLAHSSSTSKQQQHKSFNNNTSNSNNHNDHRSSSIQQQPVSLSPLSTASTSTSSATAPADGVCITPIEQHHRPTGVALDAKQATTTSGQQTSKRQQDNKSNKRNLWQNSLSRMSNKFSIFGGSQSRATTNNISSKPTINNNNPEIQADQNRAPAQSQADSRMAPQVVLDAWIETKVDFDEDDDGEEDYGDDQAAAAVAVASEKVAPDDGAKSANGHQQSTSNDKHLSENNTQELAGARTSSNRNLSESGSASVRSKKSQRERDGQREGKAEDGKYSMLQFALYNFRDAIDKYSLESRASKAQAQAGDTSTLRGSLKLIETLRNVRNGSESGGAGSGTGGTKDRKAPSRSSATASSSSSSQHTSGSDWTWRELAEMVKFTRVPIRQSLLKLPSDDLNKRAVDCFLAIMQYMGDHAPAQAHQASKQQATPPVPGGEVECVYLILMNCHNYPILRDEIYCQLMKQTTNNRSSQPDSCLRGWRLFSIVAAYFDCSPSFKPYLVKYLETAAYDKRRAYCSVASLCLQNLRKTFKYQGRKNVPSIEEIAATSAGRNSKRQIYRLPGGTERVINTKSTTVVDDIIHEICSNMLNVTDPDEMLEFSLYCIADGDLYTMPLNRDEYILDITTELIKNHQQYFLIFCRSIWHYPLRLDSKLYIEVIFNQIAPDYLEGLLLVLPSLSSNSNNGGGSSGSRSSRSSSLAGSSNNPRSAIAKQPLRLKTKLVKEIARIAALLHRASGTDYMPHKDEVKYLLPKPIISAMKQHQRSIAAAAAAVDLPEGQLCSGASGSGSSADRNPASLERAQTTTGDDDHQHQVANSPADTVITTPQKWIELVQNNWRDMSAFDTLDAKAQFLDIVRHWPLFGSSFFAIKLIERDLIQPMDFILALNKLGTQMLDVVTHETIHKYPFNEVISTRKVRSEDGALFLDLKCGNLMKRAIIRIQTDQAHEISRLIRQYIDIELLQQKRQQQQNAKIL